VAAKGLSGVGYVRYPKSERHGRKLLSIPHEMAGPPILLLFTGSWTIQGACDPFTNRLSDSVANCVSVSGTHECTYWCSHIISLLISNE